MVYDGNKKAASAEVSLLTLCRVASSKPKATKVLAYRHKANLDVKGAKAPTYRSGVILVFCLKITFECLAFLDVQIIKKIVNVISRARCRDEALNT